jgi:hypothetical protein
VGTIGVALALTLGLVGCSDGTASNTAPSESAIDASGDSASATRQRAKRKRAVDRRPSATMAETGPSSNDDLSSAIPKLRDAYVACATVPEECVTTAFVANDSPASLWLDEHLGELMLWNIARARDVPGNRISIRELVPVTASQATARLCIADDLPLVDRVEPSDPDDDIPYVNPLLSIMSRWELRLTPDGWRLVDLEPIGYFPESATCEVPDE